MKKALLLVLFSAVLSSPVFAESALEVCTAEAKDAGIQDADEFRSYVDECVEQVSAEMQQNGQGGGEPEQQEQNEAPADAQNPS